MSSRKAKAKLKTRLAKRLKRRQEGSPHRPLSEDSEASPLSLRPKPLPGETTEDMAVFTRLAREKLSEDLQVQARAVADSLELVSDGHFDQALECVKNISRGSPYADWRLFIRGLIAFYRRDIDASRQNWSRLDQARRPARIASTMLLAGTDQPLNPESQPRAKLVDAARKLQRRLGAVGAAKQIAGVKHHDPASCFSASQVAMLSEFRDDFRKVDRLFVARFSAACVRLSYFEPNPGVFATLKKFVPGPPHDPHWNLQSVLYYRQFSGAEEMLEKCAYAYIKQDLPQLTQLKDDLRSALASCLYMLLVELELQRGAGALNPFSFMSMFQSPDFKEAEGWTREAIKHYPANRRAHTQLLLLLQLQLAERGLNKRTTTALENRLLLAKEQLVKAFPDEVEMALWLIDQYFDNDQLEQADKLVRQLGGQRLDDPRAKSLAWKLKLREAMRLSRRKTSLDAARSALDVAESLWPGWLNRDWLPFLKAAIELRAGDREKFTHMISAARENCGAAELLGDVMVFAALQQMNLPSAELKPFREIVERQALNAKKATLEDLCALGSFFWDLSRTGLRHKGYRLQASKFGKALVGRLKSGEKTEINTALEDACSWMAKHSFWQSNYGLDEPRWIAPISRTVPKVAAAVLDWLVNEQYSGYSLIKMQPKIALLEQAAKTENDAFYRHRFETIAKAANAKVAETEAARRNPNPFSGFDFWNDDSDDDDSDDDDSDNQLYDEDGEELYDDAEQNSCNCPACRAKRARQQQSKRPAARRSNSGRSFQSSAASNTLPLFGLEGDDEVGDGVEEQGFEVDEQDENQSGFFRIDTGYDPNENFIEDELPELRFQGDLPDTTQGPSAAESAAAPRQTAEERRASLRERRKELQRKKKKNR